MRSSDHVHRLCLASRVAPDRVLLLQPLKGGAWLDRRAQRQMEDLRFDRQFRTPYSEGYHMMTGDSRLGSLDLHFTATTVHCTLMLERQLDQEALAKLIEQIDEDLVLSADVPRDDFLVSVYIGTEAGFFNDTFRADQEELTLGEGEEEEEEDGFGEDDEDV